MREEQPTIENQELLEKLQLSSDLKDMSPGPAESTSQENSENRNFTDLAAWGLTANSLPNSLANVTQSVPASMVNAGTININPGVAASAVASKPVDDNLLSKFLHDNVTAVRKGPHLEAFLVNLYNKPTEGDDEARGIKRSASEMNADSTESSLDAEPSTSSSGSQSKLLKRNVLLAQLLSQKAPQETVVHTQHTVSPGTTPQARLPKVSDKIIESSSNHSSGAPVGVTQGTKQGRSSIGDKFKESGKKPTIFDKPITNPNSPFPGNTSKEKGLVTESGTGLSKAGLAGLNAITGSLLMAGTTAASLDSINNAASVAAVLSGSSVVTSTNADTTGVTSSTDSAGSDPLLSQVSLLLSLSLFAFT